MLKLPQITGDTWFNSAPLKNSDISDKIVLVDFWTYSCVNCLRTLPYLRAWHEKYKDKGLVIIGIHTPEFEFEKNPENVQKAITDLNITWPVVLDNQRGNWDNFNNHYWPAKYLADAFGNIVYTHFGEGSYGETEKVIHQLLSKEPKEVEIEEHTHGDYCFTPTSELYCGYERGFLGNAEDFQRDKTADYKAPDNLLKDSLALSGKFLASAEYVETKELDAALLLKFHATEVNLVLAAAETTAIAEVTLNDNPLADNLKGADVGTSGKITIEKSRMYNLLSSRDPVDGILKISAKYGNWRAYAFTFSGCVKSD